jgi:succinyl-CoA synthetase alpha subunit
MLTNRPIAALVAGVCAQEGHVMGHAGAWSAPGEGSALDKWKALEGAGCVMVDHPAKFGEVMKLILEHPGQQVPQAAVSHPT